MPIFVFLSENCFPSKHRPKKTVEKWIGIQFRNLASLNRVTSYDAKKIDSSGGYAMMAIRSQGFRLFVLFFVIRLALATDSTRADTYLWNGFQGDDWNHGPNWVQPPCTGICGIFSPGPNDDAIVANPSFGIGVNLTGDVEVQSLEIGSGMNVRTDGFYFDVGGGLFTSDSKLRIDGFGSRLSVVGDGSPRIDLYTNQFQLTNGGVLRLIADAQVELTDIATSNVAPSSLILGNGSIRFGNVLGSSNTVFNNDGAIIPSFGDLTITAENNGKVNLDGASGNGLVDVDDGDDVTSRSLTLTVDAQLSDNFDGIMRIGKGDRIHFTHPWQLGTPLGQGSLVEMNGRDRTATISGASMVMDDGLGRIEVQSGTARFESDLSVFAGTIAISDNTVVDFASNAFFSAAESHIDKSAATHHEMIVRAAVEMNQPDFDWDGPSGQHVTTIVGGHLQIRSEQVDVSNHFSGTINIVSEPNDSAVLTVSTTQPWFVEGTVRLDGTSNFARVTGTAPMSIGNGIDNGPNDAFLIVDGPHAQINASVEFEDDANVVLNAGSRLRLTNFAEIEEGVQFSGTGELFNDGMVILEEGANVSVRFVNNGDLTWNHGGNPAGYGSVNVAEFEQTTAGELTIWLRDAALGESDQLNISNTANLDGNLQIGFLLPLPERGDEFTILTASSVIGEFDNAVFPNLAVTDTWRLVYGPGAVLLRVTSSGDFNGDGNFDCLDVDALVAQIAAGSTNIDFDLTGDGQIDSSDLIQWLADAGASNLPGGVSYLPGDANLDGVVDGLDFIEWNEHAFTSTDAWCSGDFTADGFVDGLDFVVWNVNRFTSSATTAVPEPGWSTLVALLLVTGPGFRRRGDTNVA
jgi:hypothetical protein